MLVVMHVQQLEVQINLDQPCSTCGGAGKVRSQQGFFSIERPCPTCGGEGSSIKNPCLKCSGTGNIKNRKQFLLLFRLVLIQAQEFE